MILFHSLFDLKFLGPQRVTQRSRGDTQVKRSDSVSHDMVVLVMYARWNAIYSTTKTSLYAARCTYP